MRHFDCNSRFFLICSSAGYIKLETAKELKLLRGHETSNFSSKFRVVFQTCQIFIYIYLLYQTVAEFCLFLNPFYSPSELFLYAPLVQNVFLKSINR